MSATVVGQKSLMLRAWNLLMDESVTSIAILGPGGIGKTTLMKHLYSKLISSNHFDSVIWITVSSSFAFQKIQDDISKSLGLFDSDWAEKSPKEKSQLIGTEINSRKSVLFLDDLWFHIDLRRLGVEGSKFIYSTRFIDVPERLGAHTVFELEELQEKDAWELFCSKVGDDEILQNVSIMGMAQKLMSKCKGLPILISTLGAAMSGRKTRKEWESAAREIEKHRRRKTRDEATSIFNFCFDCLTDDITRSCLSYFSLFPEDFTILKKDLIDFWICDNIIGACSTRGEALSLGYDVMHTLIRARFLEDEGNDCVKLLDMIRDFAKARVAKVIPNFSLLLAIKKLFRFLKRGLLFVEQCYEEPVIISTATETIGWISSMGNSRSIYADVPTNLFDFLLNHNPFIMIKPRPYSSLYNLTVLDLSNSGIVVVPRDVSTLVSLQYLNLSHTWIEWLPIELKTLTKLWCLNLEYADQLRMIPKDLMSSFSSLRILKMFGCGFSVEEDASNMLSVRNMDINPLLTLENLEVLSITITCASALHTFFNTKLLDCTESLSLEVFWGSESLNITPLALMKNLLTFEIHQAELLKEFDVHYPDFLRTRSLERLQEVTIEKCSSLEELTWVILVPNLTFLRVKNCEKIQEIISREQLRKIEVDENLKLLEKLEILSLDCLPELCSIYETALPFQSLKKMEITDCCLLKKLPLNFKMTKANEVVIKAEEDWWKDVEWEDEASKATFLHCFKPLM